MTRPNLCRQHNTIQKDRYKKTVYIKEFDSLEISENGEYMQKKRHVSETETDFE
ncbi:MAG: hypothetical protein NC320_13505 [Clostridium sp.]|nr:hypothetical protein [Clostridium sp.]